VIRHQPTGAQKRGLGYWWTFAVALIAFAALIVAIVQNSHHVRLHYLAWHANVSLIVVILTTALVAVFLDEVGGLIWRGRRRARVGRRDELQRLRVAHDPPADAADEPAPDAEEIPPSNERGS